jgi:hypothetical protein
MTVRLKLSMTVRLKNIVDDSPLAFVDDRTLPQFLRGFGQTHDLGPKMLENKFVPLLSFVFLQHAPQKLFANNSGVN